MTNECSKFTSVAFLESDSHQKAQNYTILQGDHNPRTIFFR